MLIVLICKKKKTKKKKKKTKQKKKKKKNIEWKEVAVHIDMTNACIWKTWDCH